jgi:secreted trypsin-like serine protease
VVSFGFCTFRPNIPSTVFTRISTYPNWILRTICANSLHPPTTDMCNGIVPLARIPKSPSSPPMAVSPTFPFTPTSAPIVTGSTDALCQRYGTMATNATTNECTYLIFFRNRGTQVHRSILGVCIQKCTIFRNLYLRTGWDCGPC